jgi:hypothetical protein
MRGEFHVSVMVVLSVLLFITVTSFLIDFVYGQTIQPMAGGHGPSQQNAACNSQSGCSKGVCMSVNGQPNFCGCFESSDCGGTECKNQRCV